MTYSGLIRCGLCGCQLVGEFKKNKYIYYHCTGNKGGECKKDYITQENIDKMIAEILKLIIIPVNVKKQISNSLKVNHEKKVKILKETQSQIKSRITKIETKIEKIFDEKLEGNISNEEWKKYNTKYQAEKDTLIIHF